MPDLAMRRLNTLSAQSRRSPSSILISIMNSSPQRNASGPPVGSGGPEAVLGSLAMRALRARSYASRPESAADLDDVLRRRPLGALYDIELHTLAFGQCLEALALNCRVMHETILLSVLRCDEPEALRV